MSAMNGKKNTGGVCEECAYFVYDEDYEDYFCEANLDEDEMLRLMRSGSGGCPFFRRDDEYGVVRRQN